MSDKIKELAEQAGFSQDKFGLYWDEDNNADGVDLDKFAVLIIAHCLEQCNTIQDQYRELRKENSDFTEKNRYAEGGQSALRVKNRIIDTFGV